MVLRNEARRSDLDDASAVPAKRASFRAIAFRFAG